MWAQVAFEHASALLDYVAAGKRENYDEIRPELADAFKEAGLSDVSNFIIAST